MQQQQQQQQQQQRRRRALPPVLVAPRERDESIYFCIPTICYATLLKISGALPLRKLLEHLG